MNRDQARRLLGLGIRTTPDEVRAAYRAALKTAHPDQGGTEEKLRVVLEAFRLLGDEGGGPEAEFEAETARDDRLEISPVIAVVGGLVTTRLADGRRVTISLPPGKRQGDQIKFKDIVLSIAIKGRREMFVAGDNLCMMVRTTPLVLLEGGLVTVKLPSGPKTFWVKPTDPSHIVHIMGGGLPATKRHKQGNLILKLVPERGPKEDRLRSKAKKFSTDWAPA